MPITTLGAPSGASTVLGQMAITVAVITALRRWIVDPGAKSQISYLHNTWQYRRAKAEKYRTAGYYFTLRSVRHSLNERNVLFTKLLHYVLVRHVEGYITDYSLHLYWFLHERASMNLNGFVWISNVGAA